jgi:hypothetical protein
MIALAAAAVAAFFVAGASGAAYNEGLAHELLYISGATYCPEASILAWNCAVCQKVPALSKLQL